MALSPPPGPSTSSPQAEKKAKPTSSTPMPSLPPLPPFFANAHPLCPFKIPTFCLTSSPQTHPSSLPSLPLPFSQTQHPCPTFAHPYLFVAPSPTNPTHPILSILSNSSSLSPHHIIPPQNRDVPHPVQFPFPPPPPQKIFSAPAPDSQNNSPRPLDAT